MEPEEEIECYRNTLDQGLTLICVALGVEGEHYDRDQTDFECYLDCIRDAAQVIKDSGIRWNGDEAEFLPANT